MKLLSLFLLRSVNSSCSVLLDRQPVSVTWQPVSVSCKCSRRSVATNVSQLVSIGSSRRSRTAGASRSGAAPATAPKTWPVTPHGIRSTATTADWTPDTLVRPWARTGPVLCTCAACRTKSTSAVSIRPSYQTGLDRTGRPIVQQTSMHRN